MADRVIRPSLKQVKMQYGLALLILVAATFVHLWYLRPQGHPAWAPAIALLAFLPPIRRHLRRQFEKLIIAGDKIRYEVGLLSKTTRNLQLSKIQDVRVDQCLAQRLLDVGNIAIETSGETSRLEMDNIDRPQAVADELIAAAQHDGTGQAQRP